MFLRARVLYVSECVYVYLCLYTSQLYLREWRDKAMLTVHPQVEPSSSQSLMPDPPAHAMAHQGRGKPKAWGREGAK